MATNRKHEPLFKFLESLDEDAWVEDLTTGQVSISHRFWDGLGYGPESERVSRETVRELIHPDDLKLLAEELKLHLLANEAFEFELRFRAADGTWRHVRLRGCISERSANGEPSVIAGILKDISGKVLTARKQRTAKAMIDTLSRREQQVLGCLVAGAANKNIAHALGLSRRTIEGYRARLMEKLGVQGAAELVEIAIEAGLTPEGSADCSPRPNSKRIAPATMEKNVSRASLSD